MLVMGLTSFLIFISYNIAETGFIMYFIPNYEQVFELKSIDYFSIAIVAPISEEIIFRGFIMKKLSDKYSFIIANFIQSLIFSILHMNIDLFLFFLMFGMIMVMVKRNLNIYCCILIHVLCNTFGLLGISLDIKMFELPRILYLFMGLLFISFTFMIIWKTKDTKEIELNEH
ncbi:lysostaphin resistance A-like protein [Anaerocolumna sp.]|uniref:CPBP family intramembrane glutamic endopeptidase n=1 Tax=Anaerocolumna sp. TaxID=2041569 RepID=UPI003FA45CFB